MSEDTKLIIRVIIFRSNHRRRSSVNFEGASHFCPKIYAWKINKMPEFYMIFARKINRIPEFYMIYHMPEKKLTKCPNFTRFLPEKILLPKFGPAPVSYAYGSNPIFMWPRTVPQRYRRQMDGRTDGRLTAAHSASRGKKCKQVN